MEEKKRSRRKRRNTRTTEGRKKNGKIVITVSTMRTAPSRVAKPRQSKPAAGRQFDQTFICRTCHIENCGICCHSFAPAGPPRGRRQRRGRGGGKTQKI